MHSVYYLKWNRLKIFFFEITSRNISEISKAYLIAKYSWQKVSNIEFSIEDALIQI